MGKVNSRDKGKRGELELAHILQNYGFDTRRGQQFSGKNGDADVVGVDGLHIECKRCQSYLIDKWYEQSMEDARSGEVPVVMFRKNNDFWKVLISLEDFMELWVRANERAEETRLSKQEEDGIA